MIAIHANGHGAVQSIMKHYRAQQHGPALFLGGRDNGPFLNVFCADIVFDDPLVDVESARGDQACTPPRQQSVTAAVAMQVFLMTSVTGWPSASSLDCLHLAGNDDHVS